MINFSITKVVSHICITFDNANWLKCRVKCCYLTVSHPDKPIRFTLISSFTCRARNVQFYWLLISLLAQLWLNGLDSLRQTGWVFTTQKISRTESRTHVDKNWYIIHNAGPIHDIKSMCMYTMCQWHILLHVYPLIIIIMISRLIINIEAVKLWRHCGTPSKLNLTVVQRRSKVV